MGFDILALVAIIVLAPFALYGAWALWSKQRAPIASADAPRAPAPLPNASSDPWAALPLAIAGFDAEDRLLGASRAFRD